MSVKPKCEDSRSKTFEDLLEWRQHCRDTQLSENAADLKEATLHLIDHHQDIDRLFAELSSSQQNTIVDTSDTCHDKEHREVQQLNVEVFVSCLEAHSDVTSTPVDILAALVYAECIQTNGTRQEQSSQLLNKTQQHQIQMALDGIHHLAKIHCFSNSHFIKKLTSQLSLPLELVWVLHRHSIMQISQFITSNLGKPNVFAALKQGLVDIIFSTAHSEDEIERRKDILQGFLTFFVTHGYPKVTEKQNIDAATLAVKRASVILLDSIIKDFLLKGMQEDNCKPLNIFELIRNHPMASQESNMMFFKHQLILQLTANTGVIVSGAISNQQCWTFAKSAEHVTTTYRELLLFFDEEEVVVIIQRVLEHEEVNWQAVLCLVSTFLVVCPGAPLLVKGLINDFLSKAISELDQECLITALLLARQAAAEGPQVFSSYAQWFKECFGEGNVYVTSRKSFMFLMKHLTSLVPFDPSHILKVHVQRPPHAAAKCHQLLSDYMALAKTRLADFKESLEPTGIFSQGESRQDTHKKELQDQAKLDVEQALSVFISIDRIPQNVIEASIFKFPYFKGHFLPALLTPRMLPDVADSKMKFIGCLKNIGKIPAKMIEKYELACEKEINALMEGVVMDDEEILEPMDSLRNSMDTLGQFVQRLDTKAESINCQLAVISDRLQTVLGSSEVMTPNLKTLPEPFCLDLESPSLTPLHIEVAEVVLNGFCKACLVDEKVVSWADNFVAMLSQFQPLLRSLMVRLCSLILQQGPKLESSHLHGLSIFLVHLDRKKDIIPMVTLNGPQTRSSCGQFFPVLTRSLRHDTSDWMKFTIRLSSAVIKYIIQMQDWTMSSTPVDFPRDLVEKFLHLVPRLYPDVRYSSVLSDCSEEPVQLYLSHKFAEFCQKYSVKLELHMWLQIEILVQPHLDHMTFLERKEYYRWVMDEKYLLSDCCSGDTSDICSAILNELLNHMKRRGLQSGLHIHNGCLHQPKVDGQTPLNQNGCQAEMLQLLQEMIQSTCQCKIQDHVQHIDCGKCVWLMNAIQKRLELINKKDEELEIACIMNVVTSLPAHLLLSNSPGDTPDDQALNHLVNFVNIQLRRTLMESVCSLPVYITSHFVKMLCGFDESCCLKVLKTCPLFTTSILVHINKLKPTLSRLAMNLGSSPEPLKHLTSVYACIESVISGSQHQMLSGLKAMEPWLVATALFMSQANFKKERSLVNTVNILQKFIGAEKILQYLLELCVAGITESIHSGKDVPVFIKLAESILTICPESLFIFTGDSILKGQVLPPCVCRLMPVAVFRVYLRLSPDTWKNHVQKSFVLPIILSVHRQLLDLYTQISDPTSKHNLEAFSLDFMSKCFHFVLQTISTTDIATLQGLDKELLGKMSDEVFSKINQRCQL